MLLQNQILMVFQTILAGGVQIWPLEAAGSCSTMMICNVKQSSCIHTSVFVSGRSLNLSMVQAALNLTSTTSLVLHQKSTGGSVRIAFLSMLLLLIGSSRFI